MQGKGRQGRSRHWGRPSSCPFPTPNLALAACPPTTCHPICLSLHSPCPLPDPQASCSLGPHVPYPRPPAPSPFLLPSLPQTLTLFQPGPRSKCLHWLQLGLLAAMVVAAPARLQSRGQSCCIAAILPHQAKAVLHAIGFGACGTRSWASDRRQRQQWGR